MLTDITVYYISSECTQCLQIYTHTNQARVCKLSRSLSLVLCQVCQWIKRHSPLLSMPCILPSTHLILVSTESIRSATIHSLFSSNRYSVMWQLFTGIVQSCYLLKQPKIIELIIEVFSLFLFFFFVVWNNYSSLCASVMFCMR